MIVVKGGEKFKAPERRQPSTDAARPLPLPLPLRMSPLLPISCPSLLQLASFRRWFGFAYLDIVELRRPHQPLRRDERDPRVHARRERRERLREHHREACR